jgi:hypothetical protein
MDVYYLQLVCTSLQEAAMELEKALVYSAKASKDSPIPFDRVERLLKRVRSEHDVIAFLIANETKQ